MTTYLKAITAFALAIVTVVAAQLTDNRITPSEWIVIAIAAANGVSVYLVPNLPTGVAQYVKALVVVVGAVLAAVTDQVLSAGISPQEWLVLGAVALQALMVFLAPNSPPAPVVGRSGLIER